MEPRTSIDFKLIILLLLLFAGCGASYGQNTDCIFKDTLLKIDFGSAAKGQEFNLSTLRNYQRDYSNCPNDGFYSYSTETSGCFLGDWITLTEDHTPNDKDGKMFFVNASTEASLFFITRLAGFKPATAYEFSVWMMNLCKVNGGCSPLPPNILITLETASGTKVASFKTGLIASYSNQFWKRYYAIFTTPAEPGNLVLKMEDMTNGGCGNDFVMDDITFRECYKPEPVKTPEEIKPPPIIQKPIVKETKPEPEKLKKDTLSIAAIPVKEPIKEPSKITNIKQVNVPLPEVLLKRENPVIKRIQVEACEMLLELYDNGQIDGDTVSIYHNNELLVSHAGLSEKPIQLRIKVDKKEPHHELVMVADNLGSIPPNTSLMVITANGKRYEIFISSSEQKNAKLLIDLKE